MLEMAGRPFFELNGMGATIWAKLEEGWSPGQIIHHLTTESGVPKERITNDVNNFVERLRKNLLLHDYVPTMEIGAEIVWNRGIAARCDWRLPDEFPPPAPRIHRERGIADPGVSVVPVPDPADRRG